MFAKIGGGFTPPNHPFLIGVSINYKPSILGYPYFWKHPNGNVIRWEMYNSVNCCRILSINSNLFFASQT